MAAGRGPGPLVGRDVRAQHDTHDGARLTVRLGRVEGGHDFSYFRTSVIGDIESHTPALKECSRYFASTATRRFVADLSGHDCCGKPHITTGWYRPGDTRAS